MVVHQRCLTCGENRYTEMCEVEIRQYFEARNIPLPVDFPGVDAVSLPPDHCSLCEDDYFNF